VVFFVALEAEEEEEEEEELARSFRS